MGYDYFILYDIPVHISDSPTGLVNAKGANTRSNLFKKERFYVKICIFQKPFDVWQLKFEILS